MQIVACQEKLDVLEAEALGLFVLEGDFSALDWLGELSGQARAQLKAGGFAGKANTVGRVLIPEARIPVLYVAGLGEGNGGLEDVRQASARMARVIQKDGRREAYVVVPPGNGAEHTRAVAEGIILGAYRFERYRKREEDKPGWEKAMLLGADNEALAKAIVQAEAQILARDLCNEPGNVINPVTLAETALRLAAEWGIECRVYDEKEIQDMGMQALWHVGKGSATPPRFIHLWYRPEGEGQGRVAVVGKGLTFDSGGLDIKPPEAMKHMKGDKAGACNVLGIMQAVARLKPDLEVHGIIAAAENMPGGSSYRPDDIISAKNGRTIEINNTDAEGRLTLADALVYASELNPSVIIDMATLTGACVIALGDATAGLFANDQDLADDLLAAGRITGERLWQLPLDDERLKRRIKSKTADLLNSGGRPGGAITAAMFLECFVGKDIKWAHLDIAGPGFMDEGFGYYSRGASGFGVRTILEYLTAGERG